jgi:hypothetical protein
VTDSDRESFVQRVATVLTGAAVVVMLLACAIGAGEAIAEAGDRAGINSRSDYADREVAWGNGWMLSQAALYAARGMIPAGADYDSVVGDASRFEDPLTYGFADSYLRYWLMPRYQRDGARWVICYRCDRATLGDATVVWEDADAGVSILRRAAG